MSKGLGFRFWCESVLGAAAALLAVLTLAWPDWIEGVFGVDPDNHNGSLEWAIVIALAAAAVVCGVLARREWQRAAPART